MDYIYYLAEGVEEETEEADLRLWAEIFRVHGNGDYMQWKRVSEDVVPVNITCIEDTPKTVFQVTAYNRHVEKIFDVRILQPGTILCPATDCFVHWRDLATSSEWGLNFTTSQDAKRFRDCCSFPSQKFARKASSANSLRLSPPKGKGKAVSSPNSPVHDPRRVISTPYDLNKTEPCECIASAGDREALAHSDKAATMPRSQAESSSNGGQSNFQPRGILKSSNSSTNDAVGRNAGRLSVNIDKSATFHEGQQHVYKGSRSSSAGPLADNQRPVAGQFSSFGKAPTSSRTCENVRVETAFVGKIENTCDLGGRKSVTIATTAPKEIETTEPTSPVDVEPDSQSSVTVHKDCIRILAPQPQKLLPESPLSGGSRDSVSPEWPSPPEPLTPQTPLTPVYNMEFDSDCIKKMLENLPVSPECESLTSSVHENDQGFHDDASCGGGSSVANASNNNSSKSEGNFIPEEPDMSESELALQQQLLDCEIVLRKRARDSYGRDSNPDSGIGGMSIDTAVSLSSRDSANTAGKSCICWSLLLFPERKVQELIHEL